MRTLPAAGDVADLVLLAEAAEPCISAPGVGMNGRAELDHFLDEYAENSYALRVEVHANPTSADCSTDSAHAQKQPDEYITELPIQST